MSAKPFRIHAMCLVKNEADIIEATLRDACRWADRIIVYDNGSTDDTWAIVQRLAGDQIVAWKSDSAPFQESLRAEIFNAFRDGSSEGDWWCRLDSDEFYIDDPRSFLASVPWPFHTVWGLPVEYYLTPEDLETIDFSLPVVERLPNIRHYKISNSEIRFFRDRKRLRWPIGSGWPIHIGPVWENRILYKHYKYRSPEQTQVRLSTRQQAIERGFPGWEHARQSSWMQTVYTDSELAVDDGSGLYPYDESRLPRHIEPGLYREAKLLLHTLKIWP